MKAIARTLTTAAAVLWLGSAQGGNVGAYICAVDNCDKKYPGAGQADACRSGVQGANNRPSSPACLSMCEADFAPQGKSLIAACKTGCAMFPSECLRDGAVPPSDPQLKRPRTERYAPEKARKTTPNPAYRDYRRW
jgi:hypothetical protein